MTEPCKIGVMTLSECKTTYLVKYPTTNRHDEILAARGSAAAADRVLKQIAARIAWRIFWTTIIYDVFPKRLTDERTPDERFRAVTRQMIDDVYHAFNIPKEVLDVPIRFRVNHDFRPVMFNRYNVFDLSIRNVPADETTLINHEQHPATIYTPHPTTETE